MEEVAEYRPNAGPAKRTGRVLRKMRQIAARNTHRALRTSDYTRRRSGVSVNIHESEQKQVVARVCRAQCGDVLRPAQTPSPPHPPRGRQAA